MCAPQTSTRERSSVSLRTAIQLMTMGFKVFFNPRIGIALQCLVSTWECIYANSFPLVCEGPRFNLELTLNIIRYVVAGLGVISDLYNRGMFTLLALGQRLTLCLA